MSCAVTTSEISTPAAPVLHPLNFDVLLEIILSHVGDHVELLQYRAVNHKWNDVIVGIVIKSRNYYQVPLRYGPEVPLSLVKSDAEHWAANILESATTTLIGTATSLPFDTVLVDRDFYLAGVIPQWAEFLVNCGESIRHIKFNIRSTEDLEENMHHVTDCDQVISREILKAAFLATPNLESLDFCVRFTQFGEEESRGTLQRMFPGVLRVTDLPQLRQLTQITIQEPHKIGYVRGFIKELLGMAPNLTTLYIKWSHCFSTFAWALEDFPDLNHLTTLGICNADGMGFCREEDIQRFFHFRFLTHLELDHFQSPRGEPRNIEIFLVNLSLTLTTLILGNRKGRRVTMREPGGGYPPYNATPNRSLFFGSLGFPLIMQSLRIMEVNLTTFKLNGITSHQTQFPVLHTLTFTFAPDTEPRGSADRQLRDVLPGVSGLGETVKKFSILGPI